MSIAHCSNQQQLQAWLASTAGQYLQAKEQVLYDKAVVDLFGFNALQMGCAQMELLQNSRIPNRFVASEFASTTTKNQLSCSDDFLPFADMSIDLLLLPHRLEFSERPHQTLREAARVMMPEGHLVISGFNQLSLWGATAGFKKAISNHLSYPWNGKFIGLARLKDWLALLGFEVVSVEMCCHIPPFEQPSWHKRFSFFDKVSSRRCAMLGGVYFIVAKKRVVGMTPIKPNWKLSPLKSPLIPSPTQSKPTQKNLLKQRGRKN
ncbi:methyltransferase domain-containing protein [Methylotenera sp.]|uniref:class I SAM-dependent methyltransferase n=1 Tax=Methylotenera sp. TaxID=2051956 RepID=UPI0024880AE2|nr:methyltransferase domain-containing protein [Methylotenera sp.]MDI1298202.1 methyltransferase domain-containing protein [Methylotenera sp.]